MLEITYYICYDIFKAGFERNSLDAILPAAAIKNQPTVELSLFNRWLV